MEYPRNQVKLAGTISPIPISDIVIIPKYTDGKKSIDSLAENKKLEEIKEIEQRNTEKMKMRRSF